MNRLSRVVVSLAAVSLMLNGIALGQDAMTGDEIFIEMLRLDVRQAKTDIITNVMQFSAEDAAIFWPIYKEYQDKLTAISDQRVALVKEYAGAYWSLTNTQAKDMASRWFDIQQKRAAELKGLHDKLAEKMSHVTALKAAQVEHRLNLLIDLQLANELPMLE